MSPEKHDAVIIVIWAVLFGAAILIANAVEWIVAGGSS